LIPPFDEVSSMTVAIDETEIDEIPSHATRWLDLKVPALGYRQHTVLMITPIRKRSAL
jgi:hypothetical protein